MFYIKRRIAFVREPHDMNEKTGENLMSGKTALAGDKGLEREPIKTVKIHVFRVSLTINPLDKQGCFNYY